MTATEQYVSNALREQGIYSPQMLAYAMATIQHETAGTMLPIREYGGPQQAQKLGYSGGKNYYGRGYIQLTHDYNYKDIGRKIGMGDNLYNNPDLALEPEIAAKILAVFFKERGVANKVNQGDLVGARRPVNPDNKGNMIANYANQYLQKYQNGEYTQTQAPKVQNTTESPVNKALNKMKSTFKVGEVRAYETPYQQMSSNNNQRQSVMRQSQPQYNQYVVKPGDTLSGIARQYLGNANAYGQISGYSSGNPNLIRVGEVLRW